MKQRFFKKLAGLALSAGLLFTSHTAVEGYQMDCCQPAHYPEIYNPSGWNQCNHSSCDFLDAVRGRVDFLWWRASEEGLDLGTIDIVSETDFLAGVEDAMTVIIDEARVKRPNFRYDPGFRLGFEYICPCSCWDFGVNWTHYHTTARVRAIADTIGLGFDELRSIPFSQTNTVLNSEWEATLPLPEQSFARWNLDMDLVDIEAGYKFEVSSCLTLRPSIGLRIARVNQGYKVFSNTNFLDMGIEDTSIISNSEVKAKNDFLGAGPRVGLDVELSIGCGLSIYGEAGGTIAFGTFRKHSNEHETFTTINLPSRDDDETETLDYRTGGSSLRCSRAITDLTIGLKWDHCVCFCNRTYPMSLYAAWEHHGFFKFNQFEFQTSFGNLEAPEFGADPYLMNLEKRGDLFTQGLTLGLLVGF